MKLNNKGITLVEIIISVALISIVLIFLFNLLIQVNNENTDNEVRSSYLVNQATFIKQIEEDFIEYNLQEGISCPTSDIHKTDSTKPLYLPKLYDTTSTVKCLKFTYKPETTQTYAYLFIYKKTDGSSYKTILSYYNGDFKQSVELEDFSWTDNSSPICTSCNIIATNGTPFKSYTLPIVGPDYKDYSINLSYAP